MAFRNDSIANDAETVTKSDTAFVDYIGIPCGGAGNLVVTTGAGNDITITGVLAGQYIPLRIIKVKSTSTTTTNMTGFKA